MGTLGIQFSTACLGTHQHWAVSAINSTFFSESSINSKSNTYLIHLVRSKQDKKKKKNLSTFFSFFSIILSTLFCIFFYILYSPFWFIIFHIIFFFFCGNHFPHHQKWVVEIKNIKDRSLCWSILVNLWCILIFFFLIQ